MKWIFSFAFAFFALIGFAQKMPDVSYTPVPEETELSENIKGYREYYTFGQSAEYLYHINHDINPFGSQVSVPVNPDGGIPVYSGGGVPSEYMLDIIADNVKRRNQERLAIERQQEMAKLAKVRRQYEEYVSYPDLISDGWHNVTATDNSRFCTEVKVLVKDNFITRFVLDDYFPVAVMAPRQIKNAKNVITLKNFYGDKLVTVEVFFLFSQTIAEKPKTGFISFWSDAKDAEEIILLIGKVRMGKLSKQFTSEPDCFTKGMINKALKPGIYSFSALGRGTIDWEGTFEVKENMCLKYHLGRSNRHK